MTKFSAKKSARKQRGFTLIEMMIAVVMILVGLVAVAQLVSASIALNSANRDDSTSIVLAQNELNQFVGQSLSTFSYTDNLGNVCTLGSSGTTGSFVGSPLITSADNRQIVDYSQSTVNGYNFTWIDPNDPSGAQYDVRWAVYNFPSGAGKRFIIGARKTGGNRPFLPVNLDTLVTK
ncbi:MAG TPA: prepilin-type N-terminal cleavage/methylation domain-containing protein [Candidatus Acidoferrum sp.]|nr:prepilin-type N-terminal cleavage/methylation domain-containing protein [Candidatus Acidoferrum sp.]